jgi:hypothetical protein
MSAVPAEPPVEPGRATKRAVRSRRIAFRYPSGSLSRHFVRGDLVMSHIVAVLSGLFPEGEDFFIRSVRRYRDRITDPELAAQVAGFIGQEVTHGREHRALNDQLQEMGYPTRLVDRFTRNLLGRPERYVPERFPLAVTAALEHYTATVAECLLRKPEAQELLGDTEVRSVLLWHALEESEHKTVAFDVYRAVGGTEEMRIAAMRLTNLLFVPVVVAFTAISLARDRAAYHPVRLLCSLAGLRHSPFLTREMLDHIRAYNRRGFHPDDIDATELLERWRTELFGTDGVLVDHLK